MHSPATRASLLLRLRDVTNGDEAAHTAAWAEFVRIYGPQVPSWCRECGLQESDAAEVCQDVLVRFWKQSARFEYDPKRRFRGYLRQVLRAALSGWSAG
jgi:DNA-directed RNA polymerase specialized sigma24 family protein